MLLTDVIGAGKKKHKLNARGEDCRNGKFWRLQIFYAFTCWLLASLRIPALSGSRYSGNDGGGSERGQSPLGGRRNCEGDRRRGRTRESEREDGLEG